MRYASCVGKLALLLAAIASTVAVRAATFTVTNTNPSGPGSLSAAVSQANSMAGPDTIVFQAGLTGTITPSATLNITESVTIDGNTDGDTSTKEITVSGASARTVFFVDNVPAVFRDFRIINGLGSIASGFDGGGAILALGSASKPLLTIRRMEFDSNDADFGGAISAQSADLLIVDSLFTNNRATTIAGSSGAVDIFDNIAPAVTFEIQRSTFLSNSTTERPTSVAGPGGGGAVGVFVNGGTLNVSDSRFEDNTTQGGNGGGAILAQAFPIGMGGSIVANLSVTNSLFVNNSAPVFDDTPGVLLFPVGGAIGIDAGDSSNLVNATVEDSTFVSNEAGSRGGAIGVTGAGSTSGPFFNSLTIRNSTFFDNRARLGGGILAEETVLTVDSCTITGNTATDVPDGPAAGGISISSNNSLGSLTLRNTILDGNSGPQIRSFAGFTPGSATSQGDNLINGTIVDLSPTLQPSDITATGANLAAIAPNGLLTGAPGSSVANRTRLPQSGSPVIDDGSTTLTSDQRGNSRPIGSTDDIGAVELNQDAPTLDLDANNDSGATGNDFQTAFASGTPAPIADADSDIAGTVHPTVGGAVITLTNRPDGASESLALTAAGAAAAQTAGIQVIPYNSSNGRLTLAGQATIAAYEAALAAVRYDNSAGSPNPAARVVQVVVNNDQDSNTATATVSLMSPVDLEVTQSESTDPVTAGSGTGNLTYVVTVTNLGTAAATGVELTNLLSLPASVSQESSTPSQGSFVGNIWTVGTIAASGSATLTLVVTVGADAAAGVDAISNQASVSALNESDSDSSNDSSTIETSIVRSVDLEVSKAESVDPAVAGSGTGNLTFTITVRNNGPSLASGIQVQEALSLPAQVSIESITPSQGSFADPTWMVGSLAPTASATLTVVLTVAADAAAGTDVISDTASVSAVNEPDSNGANDSASESTSIVRQADIEVTKMESVDPATAGSGGGNLTYTVTVRNNGPSQASGIQVQEALTLPAGVSIESITPSQGSFADPTWTVGSLPPSASATLSVVLTVGPDAAVGTDVISNTASVSAVNEPDSNSANDSASQSTSIQRQVDIQITKMESADPVVAGSGMGNLTYTVTVRNNGPSQATGILVQEALTLPSGVSIESITPSQGSFADPVWTVGSLAPSASATLAVVLTVGPDASAGTDVISNSASLSSLNEPDSDSGNDSASERTSIGTDFQFLVTKTDGTPSARPGDTLTYAIVIEKSGPSDALGFSVSDTIPSGLLNPVWSCMANSNASCTPGPVAGNLVDTASLMQGGQVSYTLTAQVAADFVGLVENVVSVQSPTANGMASDQTTVSSPAIVRATKEISGGTLFAGGIVLYEIGLSNLSDAAQLDNPGDEFVDILPPELILTSARILSGGGLLDVDIPSNRVAWNGTIPAMSQVRLEIEAAIRTDVDGATISNQGEAFFDADGDGENESSTMTDNPGIAGDGQATDFAATVIEQVPILNGAGLAMIGLALALAGAGLLSRRRA